MPLLELSLTAGALALSLPSPPVALGLAVLRVGPFLVYLARPMRDQEPLALFFCSPPLLFFRDIATILGSLQGLGIVILGRRISASPG